jgi:predicted ATPase
VATRTERPDVVLVTGEPGIGKSRVLAHIGECLTSAGGRAFAARAYEAEAARPYGVWIDVIREILRESPLDGLPADLGLLLPEMGTVPEARDRTRLLDAVLCLLRQVGSMRPAVVILGRRFSRWKRADHNCARGH